MRNIKLGANSFLTRLKSGLREPKKCLADYQMSNSTIRNAWFIVKSENRFNDTFGTLQFVIL